MKIIVFDFDKTLTFQDSFDQLLRWRMKQTPRGLLLSPVYAVLKIASKLHWISVKREKWLQTKLFLPMALEAFENLCKDFAPKIKLSPICRILEAERKAGNRVIILSASPAYYLRYLFPDCEIMALEFSIHGDRFAGIAEHPYGVDKIKCLHTHGISRLDAFYYDSASDRVVCSMATTSFRVRNGEIISKECREMN